MQLKVNLQSRKTRFSVSCSHIFVPSDIGSRTTKNTSNALGKAKNIVLRLGQGVRVEIKDLGKVFGRDVLAA